jgi:hypothetical protein
MPPEDAAQLTRAARKVVRAYLDPPLPAAYREQFTEDLGDQYQAQGLFGVAAVAAVAVHIWSTRTTAAPRCRSTSPRAGSPRARTPQRRLLTGPETIPPPASNLSSISVWLVMPRPYPVVTGWMPPCSGRRGSVGSVRIRRTRFDHAAGTVTSNGKRLVT